MLINCAARLLLQSGRISFKNYFGEGPCGVPAPCMYRGCTVGCVRRASGSGERELVAKIKAKMTKGTSSKQTAVAQSNVGNVQRGQK